MEVKTLSNIVIVDFLINELHLELRGDFPIKVANDFCIEFWQSKALVFLRVVALIKSLARRGRMLENTLEFVLLLLEQFLDVRRDVFLLRYLLLGVVWIPRV